MSDLTPGFLHAHNLSLYPLSKLSRQSATEIPLPMLPLADTEKLIREKDEEVSKHCSFPPISVLDCHLVPIPALPGPTACYLVPHSCAACKKCWRRCKPRCNRTKPRASNQMCCEILTAAYPSICAPLLCYPIPALDCPAPNPEIQRIGPPLHLNLGSLIRKFKVHPTPLSALF